MAFADCNDLRANGADDLARWIAGDETSHCLQSILDAGHTRHRVSERCGRVVGTIRLEGFRQTRPDCRSVGDRRTPDVEFTTRRIHCDTCAGHLGSGPGICAEAFRSALVFNYSTPGSSEFSPSFGYVRSPHGPLKYAAGCNGDWSSACISSCLTSFSLAAQGPARTILSPSLIQYPQ